MFANCMGFDTSFIVLALYIVLCLEIVWGFILHTYFRLFIISPKCFQTKAVFLVSVYMWSLDEAKKLRSSFAFCVCFFILLAFLLCQCCFATFLMGYT